ncbi:NADPH-dependent glutamate synthase, partial [Dysosmobacter welbionis]
QLPQAHQLPQAVGGDGDVGNLPGDGRPIADGDAGVRLGESRGVIDAVPHHEDGMAFLPQSGHILRLVRRQHPGPEVIHPKLFRNGSGGAGAVPGEHDGIPHAQGPQGGEYLPRLLPQGIRDADHSGEHSVDGKIQLGILRGQGVKLGPLLGGNYALLVLEDEVGTADAHLLPVHGAGDAMGHQILHLSMAFLMAQAPAFGLLHHGVGHGVREVLLQAGGQTEHLRLLLAVEGDDLCHPGAGVGEGARLVKNDGVRLGSRLQELAAFHGDVLFSRLPHGGQYRQGHSQLQGTGEVHHEHRQGPCHIPGEGQAYETPGESVGHQLVGQAGRLGLGGGLQLLGPLNHLHDLVVPALAGDLFHLQDALSLLHYGAGVDRAAGPLGHRDGLTGEGCLVDGDLALRHHAVQGDDTSRPGHHLVAGLDLADGGEHLPGRCLQPYPVHMEGQALCQVSHGFLPRPVLQQFSD